MRGAPDSVDRALGARGVSRQKLTSDWKQVLIQQAKSLARKIGNWNLKNKETKNKPLAFSALEIR